MNRATYMHGSGSIRAAIFLFDRATPTRYELGKNRYIQIQSDRIWLKWRGQMFYLSTNEGRICMVKPTRKSGDWDPNFPPLKPEHFRNGRDPKEEYLGRYDAKVYGPLGF